MSVVLLLSPEMSSTANTPYSYVVPQGRFAIHFEPQYEVDEKVSFPLKLQPFFEFCLTVMNEPYVYVQDIPSFDTRFQKKREITLKPEHLELLNVLKQAKTSARNDVRLKLADLMNALHKELGRNDEDRCRQIKGGVSKLDNDFGAKFAGLHVELVILGKGLSEDFRTKLTSLFASFDISAKTIQNHRNKELIILNEFKVNWNNCRDDTSTISEDDLLLAINARTKIVTGLGIVINIIQSCPVSES